MFRRYSFFRPLAALAVLALSTHASASPEAAKRYFQNGVDLITAAQPNYQDAYYQFQLAYQESGSSWKVLGNLGLCATKLERDQEAVSYYEQYLQQGGSDIAPEERQAIEQDLLLLKGNLATLHLSSPVAELKVVDQRAGSSAPPQSYSLKGGKLDLQLRAGSHQLTASSGDRSLRWDVVLEPKAESSHTFDFDAAPESPIGPDTGGKPAVAAHADRGFSPVPGYVALGLGAVGLGLGGYFLWQSSDYADQSDDAFACNRALIGCTPAERDKVRALEDDSASAQTRGIISLAAGGALAVTGVVLLVVSGSSKSEPTSATKPHVTPWVGYNQAGVVGTF